MNMKTKTKVAERKYKKLPLTNQRFWEGIPVRDADHELRIFPNDDDIKDAVRGDEQRCVFANACRRLYGSVRVAFLRTFAYVELKDSTGKAFVERFEMSESVKKSIAIFDASGIAEPAGFLLSPPRPSERLDAKIIQNGKYRHRKATITGIKKNPKRQTLEKAEWKDVMTIRNGTGMVHFTTPAGLTKTKLK
jgi:hypothetical protein